MEKDNESNKITAYLSSLTTKELIDCDFMVLHLTQLSKDTVETQIVAEKGNDQGAIIDHKELFLKQTSPIAYVVGAPEPQINKRYHEAVFKEAFHTVNLAKLLRMELCKHDVADFSLIDLRNNYEALSDPSLEFDIRLTRAQAEQISISNQQPWVKGGHFSVLCGNLKNAENILRSEKFTIDPKSTDLVQQELNQMRVRLTEEQHVEIFREPKGSQGPFTLHKDDIKQFFTSKRGVLTLDQLDQIYHKLPQGLKERYFINQNDELQLNGIPERQFLDELVLNKVKITITMQCWQKRKLLNGLTFAQLVRYGELVFNTRIEDNSSFSRAKFEISHKFGFDAGAIFKAFLTALKLAIEQLGAFARAQLVFGLYGISSELMKTYSKNKKNRSKFLARCRKVNQQQDRYKTITQDVAKLKDDLNWDKERLVRELKELVERSKYQEWLRGLSANLSIDCQFQALLDVLLAHRAELDKHGSNGNVHRERLLAFLTYLNKHWTGAANSLEADQRYEEIGNFGSIAKFLSNAYDNVSPQVMIALDMLDYIIKAIVMTLAINALLTLLVADMMPVIVIGGISVFVALVMTVNRYYRKLNDYNTSRILSTEKVEHSALKVGNEQLEREKVTWKFFIKNFSEFATTDDWAAPAKKTAVN